jgi:hypothetical protein
MTNYRQTMADAYGQVKLNTEANDFGLSGTITDTQLANLKKVWATKSKKDITPGIKSMIAKLDVPTQVAVKHAKINVISDLIEATEDHEVSMAIGQLKTISQYASKLQSILQSKGDDYNIEAWVQSKITSAEDYMNSVGHYMENNPDVNEQLEENFSASQIARLKKEYEVMRGKKISIANANKLSQMFKNIPDSGLVDIFKADIPFLSVMAMTKMIQKNIPRPAGVKLRLEEVEILDEATQNEIEITEGKIDAKKFDSLKKGDTMTITYNSTMSGTTVKKFVVKNKTRSAKYNTDKVKLEIEGKPGTSPFYLYKRKNGDVSFAQGDMAATVVAVKEQLAEGKMSEIDAMQKAGKSAAEIAKLMKLDVKTVKSILGEVNEEELHEFKKMTVSFNSHADMSKASTDLAKKGFTITGNQKALKIDGNGADLNKYATDLKNFYGATVRAENYTIDESADEDSYDPITEACWVGWTQKGMKKKGDRMVPNCVKEEISEAKEDESEKQPSVKEKTDDSEKLKGDIQKKDAEIAQLKQKSETDKTKAVAKDTKKMVNPETGEPLLQVGIAYKHLRDKVAKEKEKEEVKEDSSKFTSQQIKMAYGVANDKRYKGGNYSGAVSAIEKIAKGLSLHPDVQNVLKRTNEDVQEMAKDKAYAIGMSTAKKKYNDEPPLDKKTIKKAHEIGDKLSKMKNEDHPAKKMFEQIEGLKNKAEKSGMPYGILKQVYDRGMAAWRGGHRPGTTQQQWAFARVNSFITKSSGTWGGADKDLAAKVKGN